ncbi:MULTISPECIES: FadR/GntR family transcriptional regulator [unclassified Schaalia]|uniref:FadR/GntR family transcriptional regulator n=1 Tax=unclassified Schaalia TaxID=2691889 RepID=UPI001E3A2C7F|nr:MULTISPECIES: GntR family transcriptional regulator [unclassified Schaalia]MCD4549255.1 GntR family transcriptional regulator [Schaalia sp. lx-260]MCD4557064.1 GntR family transcriptional regulator [Schaalia sp. lx-100]
MAIRSAQPYTLLPRELPTPTLLSRSEVTMEAIEHYILEHRLQPGDPLPTESTLCQTLGVSRSSVREALRQLQALEIVEVQQGRGVFVGQMTMRPLVKSILLRSSLAPDSLEALRQVVKIRVILDIGMADDICQTFHGTHDTQLHDIVNTMEEKAQKKHMFMDEDIAFHTALVSQIENPLAHQLTNAMWMIHMSALQSMSEPRGDLTHAAFSHRRLLEAAEQGDTATYIEAVHAHYQPILEALEEAEATDHHN